MEVCDLVNDVCHFREVMVDMADRCLRRTGNKEVQTKVKPGTTFTDRTSLVVGSPQPAVCRLCVRVPVLLKRFRSMVRWTVEHPLVWGGWVADDKALDPRDYPIKLWRSHVGCNKVTGNYTEPLPEKKKLRLKQCKLRVVHLSLSPSSETVDNPR